MAKIKLSPLVKKIQGSVDGLLFSSSRGVATVRTKVTPSDPNTSQQQNARAAMANLMHMYSQFHDDLKDAWKAYAVGKDVTAINAFLAQNLSAETGPGSPPIVPMIGAQSVFPSGFYEFECPGPLDIPFLPVNVPAGKQAEIYKWTESTVPGALPILTRFTLAGPASSPISVAFPNCGEETRLYGHFLDLATGVFEWGFCVWVEFI